jgi:hypothetical protein
VNAWLLPLGALALVAAIGCAVRALYPLAAVWLLLAVALAWVHAVKRRR